MMEPLTISGELPGGVVVDGVKHRAFTLRLPKVADNVAAVDVVGVTNNVALSAAIMACQIIKLGTLKPDQINYDLVAEMHPADFNYLEAQAGELEKKRLRAELLAQTSSAPDSPSSAPG